MDSRERVNEFPEMLESLADSRQSQMWTALPVIVEKDSEDGSKVTLKVAIKSSVRKSDGKIERKEMPLLEDVPIHFMGGGGATLTTPIKKGDEGLVVFASRSIDNWFQNGGVQQPFSARQHDLSDAMFIPGLRSEKRKLENYSKNTVQLRSDDGKTVVDMDPATGKVTVNSDGDLWHLKKGEVYAKVGSRELKMTPTRLDLGALSGTSRVATEAGLSNYVFAVIA